MRLSLHYRQAIVLNNVGVSLFENRAFGHAMGIFRCALSEMKQLVHPSEGSDAPQGSHHSNVPTDTMDKINKANKLLLKLRQDQAAPQATSMAFDARGFCLPAVLNLVMDEGCYSSALSPIKIETNDFEDMEDRDSDLDSAIMLFNLGLVHRAFAMQDRKREQNTRIHQGALRLFRMSFTLVSNTDPPTRDSFEEEQALIRNRVHAGAIFLYFQVRTLFDLERHEEGGEGLQHLSILGSELAEMMDMGFVTETGLPSAAAA